jgi:osmotically-inducible protein OsmY
VKGVQTVINEIQISESDNILNFADDLVISTKVYAKLMLDEEVNSLNYNIETVNKVVYIIGISSSSDEKKKAIDLTKEVFGVEEVVEYITIKSE